MIQSIHYKQGDTAMSLAETLEKDRAKLINDLSGGKIPAEAARAVTHELDRLLVKFNSEEPDPERRKTAAHMFEAMKGFAPAIDGIGDTKLWERTIEENSKKKQINVWFLLLLIFALLFLAGTVLLMAKTREVRLLTESVSKIQTLCYALPVLSALCFFLSGLSLGRGKTAVPVRKEQKLEVYTDAEKIYRVLHASMLIADRELTAAAEERTDSASDEDVHAIGDPELELYSAILEAGYTSEDEALSECMENLKYYLHRNGVETEDYSEAHAGWFEKMPGKDRATIRPAFTKDGELLKKGMAVG